MFFCVAVEYLEGEASTYAGVLGSNVVPRPRSSKLREKLTRIRQSRRLYDNDELTGCELVLSIAQQMVSGQIYSTNDEPDTPQVDEAFEVVDLTEGEDAVNAFERWRGFDGVEEASNPVDRQSYTGPTFYDANFRFFEVLREFKEHELIGSMNSAIHWRDVEYVDNSSHTEGCQRMVRSFLVRYEHIVGKDLLRTIKLSLMHEVGNQTIDAHGVYAQVTIVTIIINIITIVIIITTVIIIINIVTIITINIIIIIINEPPPRVELYHYRAPFLICFHQRSRSLKQFRII